MSEWVSVSASVRVGGGWVDLVVVVVVVVGLVGRWLVLVESESE